MITIYIQLYITILILTERKVQLDYQNKKANHVCE